MSDQPKLSNPRVGVLMADGAEWEAQTYNPDLLAYERTAAKHKWPPPQGNPVTWITFLAWRAGLREGHIPSSVGWESFSTELCLNVSNVSNPDGEGGVAVDPTQPDPDID